MDKYGAEFIRMKEIERRLTDKDFEVAEELSYQDIVDYLQDFMPDKKAQELQILMLENWYVQNKVEIVKGLMEYTKITEYPDLVQYYKKQMNIHMK